jgi:lipopolysaccharide transport system permease protein
VLATFGVQLWLYATPVVYPLSSVPAELRLLLLLNPLSAPVELFRFALLGVGSTELLPLAGSALLTLLLLLAALLLFTRVERSFIDTV